ncbi:hypothetical protein ACS0TY_008955 [Phlomoides rotata]
MNHKLVSQILDKVAEDFKSLIPATIRDGNFSTIFISLPFSRSLHNQLPYPPHSRAAPSP